MNAPSWRYRHKADGGLSGHCCVRPDTEVFEEYKTAVFHEGIPPTHTSLSPSTYAPRTLTRSCISMLAQADGGDLSGRLNFDVTLWLKFGSGVDCICDLKVEPKPLKKSLTNLESRAMMLQSQGVRLAWHETLTFEVHGICLLKQGKAGFAVDNVRVCRSVGVSLIDKFKFRP